MSALPSPLLSSCSLHPPGTSLPFTLVSERLQGLHLASRCNPCRPLPARCIGAGSVAGFNSGGSLQPSYQRNRGRDWHYSYECSSSRRSIRGFHESQEPLRRTSTRCQPDPSSPPSTSSSSSPSSSSSTSPSSSPSSSSSSHSFSPSFSSSSSSSPSSSPPSTRRTLLGLSSCALTLAGAHTFALQTWQPEEALAASREDRGNASSLRPSEVLLDGGVKLITFQEGTGAAPTPGTIAVVHYTGRLGAKQGWRFDSTFDHKDEYGGPTPYEFVVGAPQVIEGLSVAVQSMKVGGISRAIIPPPVAYQTETDEPLPPNIFDRQRLFTTVFNPTRLKNGEQDTLGTVIFDIRLLAVRPSAL